MIKTAHVSVARLTAGALALLLAVLAGAGAVLAQAPADGEARPVYPSVGGLDHFSANEQTILTGASVTLAVGYRHHVCLVSDADARPGGVVRSASEAQGLTWVIAAEEGSPTVEGSALTHPNGATRTTFGRESCVYWTSSAEGVQTVLLNNGVRAVADDGLYTEAVTGLAAPMPLRVRWVAAPTISLVSDGAALTAPIERALSFYGTDARGDHFRAADTASVTVGVTAGALETANLSGLPVSFAVTGGCGAATVPGAVGVGLGDGLVNPGETGSVQWGAAPVTVTIANAFCDSANTTTTVTITAGASSESFSVNWAWDGYADVSVTDVGTEGTEKLVTFHTAAPVYRGDVVRGWVCDSELQSRAVSFLVSGGSAFVAGGRQQSRPTLASVTGARIAANDLPPALAVGRFAASDSECRLSWTVRSTARSDNVNLRVTSAGFTYAYTLDFTELEPEARTFARLDQPLFEGGASTVEWTFTETPVSAASRNLAVTAVYYWVATAQEWRSWFPGGEGLGVNTLERLERGAIYFVFLDD